MTSQEFEFEGHHYKIVKIENSTDRIIIRDGMKTRRVKYEEIMNKAASEFIPKIFK